MSCHWTNWKICPEWEVKDGCRYLGWGWGIEQPGFRISFLFRVYIYIFFQLSFGLVHICCINSRPFHFISFFCFDSYVCTVYGVDLLPQGIISGPCIYHWWSVLFHLLAHPPVMECRNHPRITRHLGPQLFSGKCWFSFRTHTAKLVPTQNLHADFWWFWEKRKTRDLAPKANILRCRHSHTPRRAGGWHVSEGMAHHGGGGVWLWFLLSWWLAGGGGQSIGHVQPEPIPLRAFFQRKKSSVLRRRLR